MMENRRIAFVTGANQGLGLALVRSLSQSLGQQRRVYLGARDLEKGNAAAAVLRSEGIDVEVLEIDVTSTASVLAARDAIVREHGGIDIVISNAAQRMVKESSLASQVAGFVNTNNFGQRRMTDAFRDVLRPGARFLVVASGFGTLRNLDPKLHARFDIEQASIDDIDSVMRSYVDAVVADGAAAEGWPDWINIPSKIGQVAAMKVFAREMAHRRDADGLLVAAVCPGLIDTEASRPWFADMSRALSPEAGAEPIVALALSNGQEHLPYGQLIQRGKVIPWT
jgi:carbonyl reductase 1